MKLNLSAKLTPECISYIACCKIRQSFDPTILLAIVLLENHMDEYNEI